MRKIFSTSPKFVDGALLIVRVVLGLSYLFVHGLKKITGGPERWESNGKAISNFGIEFLPVFWGFMAAFAETFGGALLAIGLLFRPSAFLILCTMAVAATKHLIGGDPISKIAYPIELGAIILGLIVMGPGKYSLDRVIFKK